MKKNLKIIILIIAILLLFIIIYITSNYKKKNQEKDLSKDKYECCKECLCGDTIELLKNNEPSWFMSSLDNINEKKYSNSFLNFNPSDKSYAFYQNTEYGATVYIEKGKYSINEKKEIILTPDNDKNNKKTCKLGQEKDLVAVINCNKNLGTFIIQKEGILELSNTIKNIIDKIDKISITGTINKTITSKEEITIFKSIINSSSIWTGAITVPSPMYELTLYDDNNNNIAKIEYNPGNYFTIIIKDISYNLIEIDKDLLNKLLINS